MSSNQPPKTTGRKLFTTWEEAQKEQETEENERKLKEAMASSVAGNELSLLQDPLRIIETVVYAGKLEKINQQLKMEYGYRNDMSEIDYNITITNESFNPQLFLTRIHDQSSLEQLKAGINNMTKDKFDKNIQLKLLVRQHIEHFIKCREQLDKIDYIKNSKQLYNDERMKCIDSIDQLEQICLNNLGPVLEQNKKNKVLRKLQQYLDIYSYIIKLPDLLYYYMKQKDYSTIYKEYITYKQRSQNLPSISILIKGRNDVEKVMVEFKELLLSELRQKLSDKMTMEILDILCKLYPDTNPYMYLFEQLKRKSVDQMDDILEQCFIKIKESSFIPPSYYTQIVEELSTSLETNIKDIFSYLQIFITNRGNPNNLMNHIKDIFRSYLTTFKSIFSGGKLQFESDFQFDDQFLKTINIFPIFNILLDLCNVIRSIQPKYEGVLLYNTQFSEFFVGVEQFIANYTQIELDILVEKLIIEVLNENWRVIYVGDYTILNYSIKFKSLLESTLNIILKLYKNQINQLFNSIFDIIKQFLIFTQILAGVDRINFPEYESLQVTTNVSQTKRCLLCMNICNYYETIIKGEWVKLFEFNDNHVNVLKQEIDSAKKAINELYLEKYRIDLDEVFNNVDEVNNKTKDVRYFIIEFYILLIYIQNEVKTCLSNYNDTILQSIYKSLVAIFIKSYESNVRSYNNITIYQHIILMSEHKCIFEAIKQYITDVDTYNKNMLEYLKSITKRENGDIFLGLNGDEDNQLQELSKQNKLKNITLYRCLNPKI